MKVGKKFDAFIDNVAEVEFLEGTSILIVYSVPNTFTFCILTSFSTTENEGLEPPHPGGCTG